jgi:hypothetical protein
LDLPGVPDIPEWMCPLCEVDQLSADEALYEDDQLSAEEDIYEDSDLEELQHILFDDTLNATEADNEVCTCLFVIWKKKIFSLSRSLLILM